MRGAKYATEEERKAADLASRRAAQERFRQTAKGKAVAARYWKSDKGKANAERNRVNNAPKHRERDRLAYRRRVAARPDQALAQQHLKYAVLMGRVTKSDACQSCGATGRLHGHHHRGYAREVELDVVWLCPACHSAVHGKGVV